MLANLKTDLKTDWNMMAINSHFQTAEAALAKLEQGQTEEAKAALNALVEAMSRSERQAVKSQLIRLMMHVIK